MDYRLLQKLKDAGFPLRESVSIPRCECLVCRTVLIDIDDGTYYIPSLSELIEACGEKFKRLVQTMGVPQWVAEGYGGEIGESGVSEEAVAKLFIALAKSK